MREIMIKKAYAIVFLLGTMYVFVSFLENISSTQTFINPVQADMESAIESAFPQQTNIKELYGFANKYATPNEMDRTVKDKDGYLKPLNWSKFNTDNAADKISELRDVCNENNVNFAYVSYPSKSDTANIGEIYGIDSNSEDMRSRFLDRLDEYGIEILNIRDQMEDAGLTRKDIFYKTDHHWNTKAGLFAARSITQFLKNKGLKTVPENLDADRFTYKKYENCWLGETGRKYSVTWVGSLDDFIVIKPNYETSLDYIVPNGFEKSGDFSILMNESVYGTDFDIYDTSLHYSYMPGAEANTIVKNHDLQDGAKILIIKDSFSMVVVPFLSLGCGEVNMWDMRDNEASLYEYIKNNDFDMVLVAYTDFFRNDMYAFY